MESHRASTTRRTRKLANTEVKETTAGRSNKGNKGRGEMYKDGGAGPAEKVKGKGVSQGQDTEGNDGSRYYPLVDPRPEEAPDCDNSTLVQCTGTGRSPVHPLDVMDNAIHSQHPKDEGAGKSVGMYKGGGVGRSAKKKDEDARRRGDMYKVRGAGPGGMVLGMAAGGAGRSATEDRGAGLGGKVLGRTAEGTMRSNTDKVVRSIRGGGRRATR